MVMKAFEDYPSIVPGRLGRMYLFGWCIAGVGAGPSVEAHRYQKRI